MSETSAFSSLPEALSREALLDALPFAVILLHTDNNQVLFANQAAVLQGVHPQKAYALETIQKQHPQAWQRQLTNTPYCLVAWEPSGNLTPLTDAHQRFLSVVSHEFRTPLTSIKGFADTLLRASDQVSPEQQRRFLAIIKDQADRLTRMVENLLAVSRLNHQNHEKEQKQGQEGVDTPGMLSFRAVPLRPLVEKIAQNLLAKGSLDKVYENRVFSFHLPDHLPDIWADADKLEQILLNLMDNALKYSFKDTPITIQASLQPETSDCVNIQVENQGPGIPETQLPTLFNAFSRVDNPLTRQVEGTGLGLYIVQSLTHALNGTIRVESTLDETTRFIISLPVATPERQAAHRRKQYADTTALEEQQAFSAVEVQPE